MAAWAEAQWVVDELTQKIGQSPNNMRKLQAYAMSANSIGLKFLEPADSYDSNGNLICAVGGVMIRMSTDGYPTSESEGTLVVDNTVPGAYENTPFVVEGLTENTTYYFSAFPYSAGGTFNASADNRVSAFPSSGEVVTVNVDIDDNSMFGTATVTCVDETDGTQTKTATITKTSTSCSFVVMLGHDYHVEYEAVAKYMSPERSATRTAQAGTVIELTPKYIRATLYGFRINKNDSNPATRVEYLEDCLNKDFTPAKMNFTTGEFDYGSWNPEDTFFLKNNYPAMVNADGTEAYKLDPTDYTKKIDGSTSDVGNNSFNGNAMARIDRVWLKQYEEGNYEYCYICDIQYDEDFHAYAHQRANGSIMDYVWISLFEGVNTSSKLRSIRGSKPTANTTGANELTYAKANNPTGQSIWSTRSWSQYNLLWMLLILMGCSTDAQATFGKGRNTGGSSSNANFLTCGDGYNKGQFWGDNNNGVVKTFHIENLWGNRWDRIEGLVTNAQTHIMVKPTPEYNTAGTDYIDTGVVPGGTSGGYINECKMTQYGLIPSKASGSDSTYIPDGLWFAASCYAFVGGGSSDALICGFAVGLGDAVSDAYWSIGASLSCEQPLAA